MDALTLIAKAHAAPATHVVTTTYADGRTIDHAARNAGAAENWALGERRKIGRALLSRDGSTVRVVSVAISELLPR